MRPSSDSFLGWIQLPPAYGDASDYRRGGTRSSCSSTTLAARVLVRPVFTSRAASFPHEQRWAAIAQSLDRPVRNYPLRPINEPAVFVVGHRQGEKVFGPIGAAPIPPQGAGPNFGMPPMGMPGNPQAMLAHQNSNMDALERRAQRERGISMNQVRSTPTETGLVA